MTAAELIAQARLIVCDNELPYLWSDAEWLSYANDAQNEACRRSRLIVDASTTAICQISLTSTETFFNLDPRILFIRRAKLDGRSLPLKRVSYKDLDRSAPGWEDERSDPAYYVPDMGDKFRPYPSPSATGVVRLTVVRLPLEDMGISDEPEIKPHLHSSLVDWMAHKAYSKQDSEVFNPKKAVEYLADFEREFGKKSTAIDEAWLQRESGYTEEEGNF